jgi:hypothetical protein
VLGPINCGASPLLLGSFAGIALLLTAILALRRACLFGGAANA